MKKRVWIMNHYSTNHLINQGGRHYWFAKYLKRAGYEPVVFGCNVKHNDSGNFFEENPLWQVKKAPDGFSFVVIRSTPYTGNGLSRVKNMAVFALNLIRTARQYAKLHGKPDVILASSVHPLTVLAGEWIAKRMKVPCIAEIRDLWPESIFSLGKVSEQSIIGRFLLACERTMYKNANAIIFTKEGDKDYLIERGWTKSQGGFLDLSKCFYINNGVDISSYDLATASYKLTDPDLTDKDKFNVIYTGSIRLVNNVGLIVECAAIINSYSQYKNIQFLIYGNGNEFELLKERADKAGLANIKFLGSIHRKYIPYVLSRSSVNILNYDQDKYNWSRGNSSNKLFEYMASGKPVISTVRMGYSIIDKYECGMELSQSTPKALADAILMMYHMPEVEYRSLCRNARLGAEDFDFSILTDKLMDVINSVMPSEKSCVKMENI